MQYQSLRMVAYQMHENGLLHFHIYVSSSKAYIFFLMYFVKMLHVRRKFCSIQVVLCCQWLLHNREKRQRHFTLEWFFFCPEEETYPWVL